MSFFISQEEQPWSPLSIILSMYGSRISNKLLYRYPLMPKQQNNLRQPAFHLNNSINDGQDLLCCEVDDIKPDELIDEKDQFLNYSDDTLACILSPGNMDLCEQAFDVKINGLRFVGFMLKMESGNLPNFGETRSNILMKKRQNTDNIHIKSFNVVFVLKTTATFSMIRAFTELAAKIGGCLRVEEVRSQYFSQQARLMLNIHDDENLEVENLYKAISEKSSLAANLRDAFDSLRSTGIVELFLNDNMRVSFCLYHKVHVSDNKVNKPSTKVSDLDKVFQNIRPYHGLLVFDLQETKNSLNASASTSIIIFLNACRPTKSFKSISSDIHMPLNHIFAIARHLIAWGKACIIYPLCESNIYMVAPSSDLHPNSIKSMKFRQNFDKNLLRILSYFSLPISLGDLCCLRGPFFGNHKQLIEIVIWMLRHRFLVQHHTYVFFTPESTSDPLSTSHPLLLPLKSSVSDKELSLFVHLHKYFDGHHHLEDIMYFENLPRSELVNLLDQFKSLLVTCIRADTNYFLRF